jgi:hypothetical protein
MTEPDIDRSELFLRFYRRKMMAWLGVLAVVGAIGLALMLTPTGPVWRSLSRVSLIPLALAIIVLVQMSLRSRRFAPDSREVRLALQDEWWRTNMDRASRKALIVVMLAQWPLSLVLGFAGVPAPRGAMAMATTTITLGLVTQIGLFLFYDRE